MHVTTPSRYSHSETVRRLAQAIADAGNTLFATIDQAAAARAVGLELRPTTMLVFGNPRGGTPLMAAFPPIALQLPLRLVVWQAGDAVVIGHERMAELAPAYGVPADHPAIAAMDRALAGLVAAVSTV
ncbi:MAG TPA: DUF302 domain-containing protein [Kofleriaceae bacterium]|nr:DUF302 domain-containing protein [Kofleriaceae bacterium]